MHTNYETKIVDRAIALYNERLGGRRIYKLDVIISILQGEFPGRCDKLTRATIYLWLKRFDSVNYQNRRGNKNA